MKFAVILKNIGGELDRVICEAVDDEEVDNKATEVIEGFILSIGDTITIDRVSE